MCCRGAAREGRRVFRGELLGGFGRLLLGLRFVLRLHLFFDLLDAFAQDLTVEEIEGASHWLLHEQPSKIARSISTFLAQ